MMSRLAAVAVMAMAAFVHPSRVAAETPPNGRSESAEVRLLTVPYVPQSEELCGGAALAMVLRYWGETAVLAEDFSRLLAPGGAGIRTDVLVEAVRARGWTALPVIGNPDLIRSHLAGGRPVMALIQSGPGLHHYVVVVAWANGGVILHDPSVGPYRVRDERSFDAAWAATGRWALLVLPPERAPGSSLPVVALPDTSSRVTLGGCDMIVSEGIEQARSGDAAGAELTFRAAEALCPESAAPLRELAGLRFHAEDWAGAIRMAERALDLEPDDPHTWRLLAGSSFLSGDIDGALRAWNEVAEPTTDLTNVDGLTRTRYRAVADQIDLPPRRLLTPGAFRRARRRLAELPAQSDSRLSLKPLPGGVARLNVAVLERPLLVNGPLDAAGTALRSVFEREVTLDLSSPTGNGELWTAEYRWWKERPRLALTLAVPAAGGRPGIWKVEGLWERQAYATGSAIIREKRHRSALSVSDWLGPNLRLEVRAALDRWSDRGAFVSVDGALDLRGAQDRLGLKAEMAGWAGGSAPFRAGSLLANWSPREPQRGGWFTRLGAQRVSSGAPLALWPGAGTGQARTPLLRTHPLLDGGVLKGRVFGRTLVHGGLEKQAWPWRVGPLRLGWAVFVDAAKPWDTLQSSRVPWQVDGGAGIRIAGMGRGGQFGLDVARGFDDGETAMSVRWETP